MKYQKVLQLGDPAISEITDGNVIVEEKIDGSQFRVQVNTDGTITCGSKSVDYVDRPPEKMFSKVVEVVNQQLKNYHLTVPSNHIMVFAEYLQSPHHNTLSYDRVPKNNLMIFDVFSGGRWWTWGEKHSFAEEMGFDVAPKLWEGDGKELTKDKINELLKTISYLGGATVEGIVVKNYNKFFDPSRFQYYGSSMFLAGKYVRTEFREMNNAQWESNKKDVQWLAESLRTPARWEKAVNHLREQGKLQDNMKDMPGLIGEVIRDVEEEQSEYIRDQLFELYWREIKSRLTKGLPEWYKQKLLDNLQPTTETAV